MAGRWLTDDQQRIWRTYLALVSHLQTAMNRQLQARCGLSLADYEVLVALSEHGPTRVLELATMLGWEQSRLSHQLSRMRARDLIERRDSALDRRGATVELTAAGSDALSAAAPDHAALVRAVLFDGMTPAQIRGFDEVISTALDRLD
ncbi:MarR family winged helix-turn-helix transcriptional regulator [Mycobacterium sp. CVI_P3]|uniref:MarR family winged helix-turn-helix transcriptional regulator n=1 Tax=Mycobacterium pinniadriaticum TaxID=2994102 RepID=A0ABT3SFS0_9MYCO|nr:MarR family winged helix-turn-helix transcriptional regulator [Mycobacterium pinniadriaticum]MCX2931828.1 MarR family winged helix-turn-helix transcriptional regulator [Mycobacterium pinniadriaticum]MCX2938361.1 MarR family winged helix-turn-helix transcriptional regulator [Mycobacterium pinniadriaticum]